MLYCCCHFIYFIFPGLICIIKDLELKIVDKKIDEINKNLKKLSSDEFIKNFKKDLKKQLESFKKSTIESFEDQLNIKIDTTKNE